MHAAARCAPPPRCRDAASRAWQNPRWRGRYPQAAHRACAQAEHGGGIDRVLAGGTPVHIARGIGVSPGDAGGECLDEGDGEVAGARRRLGQISKIERLCFAGFLNRAWRACGDDADCRLGARERGFEIEHVLEACHIVAYGAHGGARQHGCEQGREGGAHDARDLTIPACLCQSQSNSTGLLRCEYASLVV